MIPQARLLVMEDRRRRLQGANMSLQPTNEPIVLRSESIAEIPVDVDLPARPSKPTNQAASFTSKLVECTKWAVSFPAMLGMFLIGRVFYEGRGFVVDPDVWWHIKVGQDILRTHHFPTVDPYSFTAAGTPWIAYEWLGEIVLSLMYRLGGVVALLVMLIVLGSIIILSLCWLATVRS